MRHFFKQKELKKKMSKIGKIPEEAFVSKFDNGWN